MFYHVITMPSMPFTIDVLMFYHYRRRRYVMIFSRRATTPARMLRYALRVYGDADAQRYKAWREDIDVTLCHYQAQREDVMSRYAF